MTPIRVGVDVRCLDGGAVRGWARYTRSIVDALRAVDDVELLEVRPPPGSELVSEQLRFAREAHRADLDVLWCPANRGLPLLAPCATVLTLHDAVEWDPSLVEPASGRSRARATYASIASLASAALVITPSEWAARSISARLRVAPSRLRVVPEAAAAAFHAPPAADTAREIARRLGLPQRYVLYLGGLDPKKDVATLLRAAQRLDPSVCPPIVVAGAADARWSSLAPLTEGLDVVRLVDVDDADLPVLYGGASCFVFPAVAEGFGLPPVEAMAAGTPVLVADAGALPEVVGDGGQRFPARDDAALAALMAAILDDDHLRAVWSERARHRSRELTWSAAAAATADVLREAAALEPWRWAGRRLGSIRQWRRWAPP